jgi:hypothetical protein
MTKIEAVEFIRSCGEDEGPETAEEVSELFRALYGRAPDDDDDEAGVWSLCCAVKYTPYWAKED